MRKLLAENQFGVGAFISPKDVRDHDWLQIAGAAGISAFDWEKGFDIETELDFLLATKNQGGSYSCGGQGGSYLAEALEMLQTKSYEQRSAKFIYSQIAQQGGGAYMRDIFKLLINTGAAREILCPSYESGNLPSEAFMTRSADLTPEAYEDALRVRGYGYANVLISDIDEIAQAISVNKGCLIIITGQNNGTWLSAFPQIPTSRKNLWGHFLFLGKAKLIDGKKYVCAKNSWGNSVGENGWQWLGEEHFKEGFVPEIRTLYLKTPFKYTFTRPILYGEKSNEVKMLQSALKDIGLFDVAPTGYYGEITRNAVFAFQKKFNVASDEELAAIGNGKRVGAKTIAELNKIFAM